MRTLTLLFLTSLVQVAQAQETTAPTVLYGGDDPGVAAARVHGAADLDEAGFEATDLRPVTLADVVVGKQPVLFGAGDVSACGGAPSNMAALRSAVERAEGSVSFMEFDQAVGHLRTAGNNLACLQEPVHPETGARLFFLQGVVLQGKGNDPGALAAFRQAHTFQPGLLWDDYIAPEAKPLFDQAAEEIGQAASVNIRVVPTPEEGSLWIDGQPATGENGTYSLVAGDHIIQVVGIQVSTVRARLQAPEVEVDLLEDDEEELAIEEGAEESADASEEEGDASPEEESEEVTAAEAPTEEASTPAQSITLVIPGSITAGHLAWISDPDTRTDLDLILQTAFSPGKTLYVSLGGAVWQTSVGSGTWEELEVPTRLAFGGGIDTRRVASQALLWGGSGTAILAGLVGGFNYLQVMDAYRTGTNTSSYENYQEAQDAYDGGRDRMKVAAIIAAGGLALGSTGYLIRPKSTSLAVVPYATLGGAGFQLILR